MDPYELLISLKKKKIIIIHDIMMIILIQLIILDFKMLVEFWITLMELRFFKT